MEREIEINIGEKYYPMGTRTTAASLFMHTPSENTQEPRKDAQVRVLRYLRISFQSKAVHNTASLSYRTTGKKQGKLQGNTGVRRRHRVKPCRSLHTPVSHGKTQETGSCFGSAVSKGSYIWLSCSWWSRLCQSSYITPITQKWTFFFFFAMLWNLLKCQKTSGHIHSILQHFMWQCKETNQPPQQEWRERASKKVRPEKCQEDREPWPWCVLTPSPWLLMHCYD